MSPDSSSYGDDSDFLASSMASQKSVASDAFDFLFDENNLDPEKVIQKEFNETKRDFDLSQFKAVEVEPTLQKENSSCCVIS